LKELQSIVGLLNFITKAIPTGRAFLRRFYDSMSKVKKSFHFIRVNRDMRDDAMTWLTFLSEFNGLAMFNEKNWSENTFIELYTDASGNKKLGCGCYFKGQWCAFKWPAHWEEFIFRDITYLELVPIVLALELWGNEMKNKKVMFRSDNESLVHILNKKSSKNKRVMNLIRPLMLSILQNNIQFKGKHVSTKLNTIADSISRFQWARLYQELPENAAKQPCSIPKAFLRLFSQK
jgi:hypothetical protein